MAATALKITKGEQTYHLLMVTVKGENGTDIAIHNVKSDYIIEQGSKPEYGVSNKEEDLYHKDLRVDALKAGHFMPEFSTNPEWNPVQEEEAKDGDGKNGGE